MRLQLVVLSVLALVIPILSQLSYAISPNWLVRVPAATLENTCQCDCCYPVGFRSRTECIPPIDTSFDVPVCSECDVDACAARFPVACAQPSSIVNADCITRKGWMLRLVPVLFIAISVCLLCYGFFFKRFDGYHDDRGQMAAPVLRDAIINPYNTFQQVYPQTGRSIGPASEKSGPRSSSQLPPILETEELPATPSPRSGVSLTETSPAQVSQPSLGETRTDTT